MISYMISYRFQMCTPGIWRYKTVCTSMSRYIPYWRHGCMRNLKMVHTSLYSRDAVGKIQAERHKTQTFPFQCSHDAASPDGAASPLRRRLRAGQWELFIFFARQASSALLISGRRRTLTMISRSPIISIFSPKSSS